MLQRSRIPGLIAAVGAAAAFLWSCTGEFSVETDPEFDRVDTLQSGGIARTFAVHLPSDYKAGSSPVVILFHPEGGDGQDMRYLTQFDVQATLLGFVAVYPDATSDWAYGCACTAADTNGIDDVQFVLDLLDELDADYGINRDSVFVVGTAEGAFMAQKVVCDTTDSFAGMATVAATMPVPLAQSCVPSKPIPVMMIQGTEDTKFPWNGAPDLGLESLLAVDTTVGFWATSNGCGDRRASQYLGADQYYRFDVYSDGFDARPVDGNVILLRMVGAAHGWPNAYFAASYEIGQFFAGVWEQMGAPEYLIRK